MTTDVGTNMEKKVSMTKIRHRLLVSKMAWKASMKLFAGGEEAPFGNQDLSDDDVADIAG
jgi:hypothetical protein